MFNALVEECFDKCVSVGWDGVRMLFILLLLLISLHTELRQQDFDRKGSQVHEALHGENVQGNPASWNAI